MKNALVVLPILLLLAGRPSAAHAQTSEPKASAAYADVLIRLDSARSDRPPLPHVGDVLGQVAVGTLLGGASGVAGALAGAALTDCRDSEVYLCGLGNAVFGFIIGQTVGTGLIVYAAGRTVEVSGNFVLTMFGAGVGIAASIAILWEQASEANSSVWPVLFLGPPLGATLFNNLSRRYRTPPQGNGLINLDGDGFYVGILALSATRLADPHRTVARSVRLFTASW